MKVPDQVTETRQETSRMEIGAPDLPTGPASLHRVLQLLGGFDERLPLVASSLADPVVPSERREHVDAARGPLVLKLHHREWMGI